MQPSLEYCAARYLDQWIRKEEQLVAGLQNPSPESLRSALGYFKVSRGFAGISEKANSAKVLELLLEHDRYVTPKTASKRVTDLANNLGTELGYDNLLSAASKLLWLRSRSPFVIFDTRAVRALRHEGQQFKQRDYGSYVEAWRKVYSTKEAAIALALQRLSTFVAFTAAAGRNKEHVDRLISQNWFAERTFDQYLWLVGAPKKRQKSGSPK